MSNFTEGEKAVYGFLQYRRRYVGEDHVTYDEPWITDEQRDGDGDVLTNDERDNWLWG